MLYTMYIIAWMNGHMAFASHDYGTMQLCLAVKKDMSVVLKDYKPTIVCEPKLGEI